PVLDLGAPAGVLQRVEERPLVVEPAQRVAHDERFDLVPRDRHRHVPESRELTQRRPPLARSRRSVHHRPESHGPGALPPSTRSVSPALRNPAAAFPKPLTGWFPATGRPHQRVTRGGAGPARPGGRPPARTSRRARGPGRGWSGPAARAAPRSRS